MARNEQQSLKRTVGIVVSGLGWGMELVVVGLFLFSSVSSQTLIISMAVGGALALLGLTWLQIRPRFILPTIGGCRSDACQELG
ncbi:hypothetical protein K0651_02750 [Ornithinimicrobium sp. Arc0846-15]|nr:hypothetical protein [Ornithinimicrobium laminariae]